VEKVFRNADAKLILRATTYEIGLCFHRHTPILELQACVCHTCASQSDR
jgi:hypothetical protein